MDNLNYSNKHWDILAMLYVKDISAEEKLTLENMKKNYPGYMPRMRAHAVLLSDTGYEVQQIADIFGVCRQTTASWLRSWAKQGIFGLFDKPRSGRPRKALAKASF